VVLSSDTGEFNVTVVNGMEHPVQVQVRAESGADVSIESSPVLRLQPGDRYTRLMRATAHRLGSYDSRLTVTTEDGTPVGPAVTVPVQANQVSQVIWVVVGVGLVLLFGTIALRLVRRLLAFRRTRREGTA